MRLFYLCVVSCALGLSGTGDAAEIDAQYAPRTESGMGQWLKRLGGGRVPDQNERSHSKVTRPFREVTANSRLSTVRVLCETQQAALGLVIRSDGLILTKGSELGTGGKLECVFADGVRVPALKVAEDIECDLALLRVSKNQLPVVRWSDATDLPVGSWLVTPNLDPQPLAIGVVSSPPRVSPTPRAVLGVRMHRVEKGVRINAVTPGTGAARAGMRTGDIIAAINGRQADSPDTITEIIRQLRPGDQVTLSVYREASPLSMKAVLSDMSRLGAIEQAELMDSLGGPLSRRREGFPSVIQHDSVVRPHECGGPVVDLDGKVVGLNIARASRVSTYALPVSVARQSVTNMLQQVNDQFAGQSAVASRTTNTAAGSGGE